MGDRAEHTAGPWKWHWRSECGLSTGSVYAEPRTVAICPQYQKRSQWEADARLISAAPDLLRELQEVLEWALVEKAPLREQEIRSIRAAISRATGEA